MALAELKADIAAQIALLEKGKPQTTAQLQALIAQTVLPMMLGIIEGVGEDVGAPLALLAEDVQDLGTDLQDLVERELDILHAETATQITNVFALGETLAAELEALAVSFDDIRRKRITDMVAAFRGAATAATETIDTITVAEEPAADAAAEGADPDAEDEDKEDDDE